MGQRMIESVGSWPTVGQQKAEVAHRGPAKATFFGFWPSSQPKLRRNCIGAQLYNVFFAFGAHFLTVHGVETAVFALFLEKSAPSSVHWCIRNAEKPG